ncbi:uncharacterized protein LOC126381856 [Pectinophora gossypiella]|uniref:uncharacterized protein LOC126381856 n=1 Tax=Pectinophora gossypiella TaxID=13191 RepID=UPI00214F1726|nr:uncharacterized protein LOC126381856 [Pectinophora gossypiella]XP_049887336.1 uncharacterized protein LOC126381856 [Pectinophora gossypiella]
MAYFLKALSGASRLAPRYTRSQCGGPILAYSEEVLQAKAEGQPIVALESTIITHGMPYPENLETAVQVENIIRDRGAVPATVAILQGQLTIGLTEQQLQYLAKAKGVVKASRRDLAPVAAARKDGATTVAGTLVATQLADIPVFVTGGIGGVHREGESTMDVSADLTELGRSRTLVVCSGVKSILDIGRTLEYLETQGVCVCAFGESDDFPAFYTARSGHRAPNRVANAQEAARILQASLDLRLGSGILIAVPLPKKFAMDEKVIEGAIASALKEANAQGISGKEVTPFILAAVAKITGGASLDSNIALIKNNARVGADIAVEFKKLGNAEHSSNIGDSTGGRISHDAFPPVRRFHTSSRVHAGAESLDDGDPMFGPHMRCDADVLVIGGANVDRTYRVTEEQLQLDGSTHACNMQICAGGVGRNMAEALWRLRGGRARLITALGEDTDGQYLAGIAPGLVLDGCVIPGSRTASYAAVLDASGECRLGLGDMAIHNHISVELVDRHKSALEKAAMVILDGNVPQTTINHVLRLCHQLNKPVFFEPTDRRKAIKVLQSPHRIAYSSPNLAELRAMANFIKPNFATTVAAEEILYLSEIVVQVVEILIITLGSKGVLIIRRVGRDCIRARMYPVDVTKSVINVSGAGDCFACGFISGVLLGRKESECVSLGFMTAKRALHSKDTVPSDLVISVNVTEAPFELIT